MSDSSGEELDRILQPNKDKLPSLPRHDPPDDLSDDEEFAEKLRQIKETYQNKPLPTVTKQTPIVRRLDEDDRDDYGGHSDEEDNWSSRGRQSEASSRRDVFSTSTSNSKNTFDMHRSRISDVFPRRMENQSRRDDSDDESSVGGLLERVVPERIQHGGLRRVTVGNSRDSNSRNSRRFGFDTKIRARPSQRPAESTRPRDTSRSRSRHQEQSSSSPSRRNAAPLKPLPKDPRRKDPSDHEDLDNELDAEISGLVGQNSVVERSLSPGDRLSYLISDKIGRRMTEQKRLREAAPPPNDSDMPMSDDDDLPFRFSPKKVSKEPKSSRPKPSEPKRITGDWDEPATSSETPKQGVKRPTMTDFFKPAPRPGRVPDQPPHRDLEGFKKTAVEWLNAKAVPAVKPAQGAGGSGAGSKQLLIDRPEQTAPRHRDPQRPDQAAPKPLQTPGSSRRAPEQAAPKPLQRPEQAAPRHRDPQRPEQAAAKQLQRPEHAAPKQLQAPGSQGRVAGHTTSSKQPLRPEQAAPKHRDPQRPEQASAKPLQTPGRAPEHAAPKPLHIPGTSRRALEQAALKTPQTPGGQGRLERLAGHPPSSKQLLRPEQAAPRHRDPQRPDQAAPKALQTPGGQGRLAGQPSSKQLRAPGTSGRAPEQAAPKQLLRPEHRAPKPLQTPGTSGRRPEHAAPKHPHRQAAPRHRTPSPALLEPKIEVFSDDDDNHFSDLDHHAPRTPYDPNKTAKSLAKMDAVNKKHKANLDAKLEAKRREYELMEAELEKKRAVLEEYARREEQEKRRRQAEEAERRRPKSPVRVQKFICHTCGKHFISQKKLDDHKHSHTDNVQAICPMCNTEIKFKYNLRQHMTKCQERLKEKMGNQGIAEYYPEFAAAVKIAAEDPCLDLPPLPKGFVMLENGLVVGHDPMLDVNTSLLLKSFREEGAAMARKDKSKKNTMRLQKRDQPQDITLSDDDDDNDDDQPEPNGRGRGTRGRGGRGRGGAGGARGPRAGGARGARGGARANRQMEESEPDSFDDSDY